MAGKTERDHRMDHDIRSSRYVTPQGTEAEFEPGSHGRVLRNRLHIRRKSEMDQMEFKALVTAQEAYLRRLGPDTRLTAEILCRMHRDWLDGLSGGSARAGLRLQASGREEEARDVPGGREEGVFAGL